MDKRQAYFDALLEMFESRGWKVLMDEVSQNVTNSRADGADAPDWGTVCFFKGRRTAFEEMATLEATVKQTLEAIAEEGDNDADL